jgi:hypothetical protein
MARLKWTKRKEGRGEEPLPPALPVRPLWNRTERGNLTRKFRGLRLVVFRRFDGKGYGFSRQGLVGDKRLYRSPESFPTEDEACAAAERIGAGI